MTLATDRLLLRPQAAEDAPALVALWTDPGVTRHMGGPRDRAFLEAEFAKTAADPARERFDLWPVVEKASGRVVGHCGLLDKEIEGRLEIELVYVIAESSWGRGYATEIAIAVRDHAVRTMGIGRLVALIDPANAGSERVALKAGFRLDREVTRPGGPTKRLYVFEPCAG